MRIVKFLLSHRENVGPKASSASWAVENPDAPAVSGGLSAGLVENPDAPAVSGGSPSGLAAAGLSAWRAAAACAVVLLAIPSSARGSLGGDVSSVAVDRDRMSGVDRVVAGRRGEVHEIRLPGGTLVKEYLSPAGVVFAVTWRGPFRPNLRQLLGTYFDRFEQAARAEKEQQPGRRPIVVEQPELVVHMAGHARAFFGRAYVPGAIPEGLSAADIQ